ncbi:MAG: HAMP domain-containing protein [Acidobacteria bacterium]|nr:HAMP domain-containing protein [Acidobacteriota bacterium]
MAVPAPRVRPRPRPPVRGAVRPGVEPRKPFRDNPRLILLGILLLVGALIVMITLADRSAQLSPDFLSEVVLYALSAADLTMLVALAFVLARNIIKLLVERRRALPFARFRAKLVAVLLGMTLIPAVLVLIVGSELIRNSADRWFSAPIDEVLGSASRIASDYYLERQTVVSDNAQRMARNLAAVDLSADDVSAARTLIVPEVTQKRIGMVEVYRIVPGNGNRPAVVPVVDVATPALPRTYVRASADRLAARVAASGEEGRALEPIGDGGELVRATAVIRARGTGTAQGVVVASDYLTGELAAHFRRITEAYEGYSQLRVLKRPLAGVYLSFFLMVTLMILVSATWMGLYLAKRITRPVQVLAEAAREIGAGHLDHRVQRETADEFGSLVDAFNAMAGDIAASQRKLERSRIELERKHLDVEARRRYVETILDRIATGVVSIDSGGRVSTMNSAASRLLGLPAAAVGQAATDVFARGDLKPVAGLLRAGAHPAEQSAHEIALARGGREVHLAAAATPLHGDGSGSDGVVLVFDDVTPLIRAQRVAAWKDVARRLAHEIKNPLTPIQLCAERMRRHFAGAPEATKELVDECTGTIVGEVESLKALVDEFSQFARMPAPRTVPSDLHALLDETLALYDGLFQGIRIEKRFVEELPQVRVDPEQIRRVLINLVDNAVEALGGVERGPVPVDGREDLILIATHHDSPNSVVRIIISDNGPGIPAGDREKLFMPYYSTKRRGSGLGLAIVRRIIAEHGGSIEVADNSPSGTKFTIELPC